jgi:hypothetical protein
VDRANAVRERALQRRCSDARLARGDPTSCGLRPRIGLIYWFSQSQSGDGLMNVFALFRAVALLLTATLALTFFRATPSVSDIGTLKCYDVTGAVEKSCDRPPLIVRTSARHLRLD